MVMIFAKHKIQPALTSTTVCTADMGANMYTTMSIVLILLRRNVAMCIMQFIAELIASIFMMASTALIQEEQSLQPQALQTNYNNAFFVKKVRLLKISGLFIL